MASILEVDDCKNQTFIQVCHFSRVNHANHWCMLLDKLMHNAVSDDYMSLQFEPAPRRGEPDVTRRTPDYFLWSECHRVLMIQNCLCISAWDRWSLMTVRNYIYKCTLPWHIFLVIVKHIGLYNTLGKITFNHPFDFPAGKVPSKPTRGPASVYHSGQTCYLAFFFFTSGFALFPSLWAL